MKQIQLSVGAVTYYCDMWPQHSCILAPLTNLPGKCSFMWTSVHQQTFDALKDLMVENVLLRYPDHNLPFHICTDTSDYQLGSIILQQDKPVAFYTCKLSPSQQKYYN